MAKQLSIKPFGSGVGAGRAVVDAETGQPLWRIGDNPWGPNAELLRSKGYDIPADFESKLQQEQGAMQAEQDAGRDGGGFSDALKIALPALALYFGAPMLGELFGATGAVESGIGMAAGEASAGAGAGLGIGMDTAAWAGTGIPGMDPAIPADTLSAGESWMRGVDSGAQAANAGGTQVAETLASDAPPAVAGTISPPASTNPLDTGGGIDVTTGGGAFPVTTAAQGLVQGALPSTNPLDTGGGVDVMTGGDVIPPVAGEPPWQERFIDLLKKNKDLAPWAALVAQQIGGAGAALLNKSTAEAKIQADKDLLATRLAAESPAAKRGLIQSGSYGSGNLGFSAPGAQRPLLRPGGPPVYGPGGLIRNQRGV